MLAVMAGLRLASSAMFELYEQIVVEMCELREVDTAKALMRTAPVSQSDAAHTAIDRQAASSRPDRSLCILSGRCLL